MEARRRRRFLERTSHVSNEESTSWRSKVYQKEDTSSSYSTSYHKDRSSYRAKDGPVSIDNVKNDAENSRESRRRRSEDTNDTDLSDRLARRRQRRLEEQGDSSSLDGSFDSPRFREKGWSRDSSVRSVDSTENADVEERLHTRRLSRRHEADSVSGLDGQEGSRASRRSSRDSVMSVDSVENVEDTDRSTRRWSRRRDSEGSNKGEQNVTSSDHLTRKWSSKDSSLRSIDSTSSFKSCDDGEGRSTERERTSRGSSARHSIDNGHLSSGSKDRSDNFSNDTNNNCNNNNASLTTDDNPAAAFAARRRRMRGLIDECDELPEATLGSGDTEHINGLQDSKSQSTSGDGVSVNGVDDSSSKSRWRSHIPLKSTSSLDGTSGTPACTSASLDTCTATASMDTASVTRTMSLRESSGGSQDGGNDSALVTESFQARLRRLRGEQEEEEKQKKKVEATTSAATTTGETSTKNDNNIQGNDNNTQVSIDSQDIVNGETFTTPPSSPRPEGGAKRLKSRRDRSAGRHRESSRRGDDSSDDDSNDGDDGEGQLASDTGQQDGRTRRRVIHATRQKFNRNPSDDTETPAAAAAPAKPKPEVGGEDGAVKKLTSGRTDFSQLLQKFSGSESEKSDTDPSGHGGPGIPRRRSLVKRQAAKEIISSSEESDASRRTPERTQSLKLTSSHKSDGLAGSSAGGGTATASRLGGGSVGKSSSFRSEFMSRRMTQKSDEASPRKESSHSPSPSPRDAGPSSTSHLSSSSSSTVVKTKSDAASDNKDKGVSAKGTDSLDQSLDLLSRVTEELDHPERPSSLQTTPPDLKSPSKRDSRSSIDEAEEFIKQVDSNITSLSSRRSPDKSKSPNLSPGSGVFTFNKPADASERQKVPATSPSSSPAPSPLQETATKTSSAAATSPTSLNTPAASLGLPDSPGIKRTSSMKDTSVCRTDSMERRKGILKRTTSLTKQDTSEGSSFPIVDPQLAKILQQRKQMVGDLAEEEEEDDIAAEKSGSSSRRRSRQMSAAEEIEETLKYSKEKAAERGINPDQDELLKRRSVADRIYSMQTKIEEEKYAAVTSRSKSGISTPKSRPRSGFITPTQQKSLDESLSRNSSATSPSSTSSATITATSPAAASPAANRKSDNSGDKLGEALSGELNDPTTLSGPQLMEKLTKIADANDAYQEKRQKFQSRNRNDWRHQTQPVTYEEIRAADSLEAVSAFRAQIRKKTSINAFDQIKAQTTTTVTKQHLLVAGKKTEFPQHLAPPPKMQRRNRRLRHRTLPVTAEELNAVPENQMLVTEPEWAKADEADTDKRDSKADSGILSGSDADSLFEQSAYAAESLRSLTLEMDLSDNDPSRMSITDKASMFRALEEKTKAERDKEKSASGAKRYINRKKRERSQTMPITEDEVKTAAEMGDGGSSASASRGLGSNLPQPEVVNRSRSSSIAESEDKEQSDDELLKLSLSEKVKLFSQLKEKEKQPSKAEAPVVKRRNRKQASRFSTQPVTSEEVEKAAAFSRISPLAMSMVKPPDPEILKGLPLKDQRELMAAHAEMCLSQSSLRSQSSRSGSQASLSQPSSRRASMNIEDVEGGKVEGEEDKGDKRGILKDKSASTKDLNDVRSILKTEPDKAKSEPEVHSILKPVADSKPQAALASTSPEPRGILKKTKSEDIPSADSGDDVRGILKYTDSEDEEHSRKPRSRSNSQPLGILKRDGSPGSRDQALEIKGILKAPSQESVHEAPVKSAMRRGSMDSDSSTSSSGVLKSAMKNRSKNNSESEEGQGDSVATSDLKGSGGHRGSRELTPEGDLNVNNATRHVDLTISVSEQHDELVVESSHSTQVRSSSSKNSSTKMSKEEVVTSSEGRTEVKTETSYVSTTRETTSSSSLQVPEDADAKSGQSASEGESSSGEILDDTGTPRRLKRKSRFSSRAAKDERYKTQPPELTGDKSASTDQSGDSTVKRKYKYEGRHKTQPITPDEMREAEATTPVSNLTRTPGGSIADRLNQLKTSGEEEWRKRVGRKDDLVATPDVVVKLREKSGMPAQRPSSIADRLNDLEFSKSTWQKRVEDHDAKQFTVAGKLANTTADSPLVKKLKNLPKKDGDSSSRGSTPLSSPVTPTKEFIAKIPLPKDIVQDPNVKVEPVVKKSSEKSRGGSGGEEEEKKEPVKVEVPDMGREVESFFAVKDIQEITDKVAVEVDDFNNIFIEAEMPLATIRRAKPARKQAASTHNPLKSMSQKIEIRSEYTEVTYGTAEKELRRVKRENLAKDAGFAQAALAGLASTENFKGVELRRSDSGSSPHGGQLDPFNELMLLHVKGRRTVQTRLVEPNTRSMNEGDCYIMVTPDKVIHWEGQYANVIEKAKASEVASFIQQKKDLGCKKASEVLTVYQAKDHLGAGKLLWAALEGEKQCQACGPDAEDELYESSITKCNMVYRLEGNALLPYEEYWGAIPRHEMLKKNEVIIFDFGSEFYVWQGKAVSMEQRRLGMRLAKQLYEKGYDYTESIINPLSPLRTEEDGGLPSKSATRPKWSIFGKVNQNMETILFREKFSDWPDSSRLIGCKGHGPSETANKDLPELKPYDAAKMIPLNTTPVTLKLEGANVGRGVEWSEDMQGFIKKQDIITREVTVWHVMEYEHFKLPEESHGQFHDGDTYVVRWQYMIANANLRSLKGSAARNSLTGRERCAYFFWQGNNSTINEKGASALMTVELDEERGPQVRVLEGKEPPCFLNLFEGKMVLHIGKREEPTTNTHGAWRLYCLRGDYENEIYLLEVPVSIEHLRSRSSLVLLNVHTGIVYIWHGVKSPQHVRQLCRKAIEKLKENTPLELGLHEKASIVITEVEEGEEKKEIWSALDSRDRTIYHSLLTDPKPYTHTLRLFHMSSVNMVFEVHEQLNPTRPTDCPSPFPFLQADLYKSTQPALFLVDNEHEVYLWQGWWPIGSHDTENVHTGSATARFNMDRKCAMQTTLHYCKEKNPAKPPIAYLVCAGVEPASFTSLFPYWMVDTVVKDMALEEGKTEGYMEKVSEILHRLTETRYTLAELQERPLPEGVDPLKLESYLDDTEFEEILDMPREEFYAQPPWKQRDMKKHVGLF